MKTKTRKLVWNQAAVNSRTELQIYGYTFKFDKNLRPIPVDVTEDIALELLSKWGRQHKCCSNSQIVPMFVEV